MASCLNSWAVYSEYALRVGKANSKCSSSHYLCGCPRLDPLVYLTLSLNPGENTTWCTGSDGGLIKQIASCLSCADVSVWEGSVGLPANFHTRALGMCE